LLLLLFFPVYLSGSDRARLWFQATTLAVLGLWLNSLLTEVDWVNLSMGHWPDPVANPLRWLLIGFVAVTALLFGPVWCGYCCPFGALQEFISRLGRWLRVRVYPGRPLDVRARVLKFLLLALMSIAVWLTADPRWAAFDPMQYVFGLSGSAGITTWMAALMVGVLIGALFHYRFWSRYFCPLGALLALSNKLALLQRLAPKRRFNHCDLGIREEFDIDCIRCNRCISGADTRLRPPTKYR
jgi:polyferredoxin